MPLDFTQKSIVSGLLMNYLDVPMAHSYDVAAGFNDDDLNRLVVIDEEFQAIPLDAEGVELKKNGRDIAIKAVKKLVDDCAARNKEEAKARIAAGEKPSTPAV